MKMNSKALRLSSFALGAAVLAGAVGTAPVKAAVWNGWEVLRGQYYWYEDGIRQGYDPDNPDYRGKEIYDPSTGAWYWLDNIEHGARAESKDVYQESVADATGAIGKWVRYDRNGQMVKGWDVTSKGTYYFNITYGTMAKGNKTINGVDYHFNEDTGVMDYCSIGMGSRWVTIQGREYWYENGIRQGYDPNNPNYRGKEIYDAASGAWYWLDNASNGAKAVDKDVYQESCADALGNIGKWVRYDSQGHMVKGWDEKDGKIYYFDPNYGTMARGDKTIDGVTYHFDEYTGVCKGAVVYPDKVLAYLEEKVIHYDADGNVISWQQCEYDDDGNETKNIYYGPDGFEWHRECEYVSDASGSSLKYTYYNEDGSVSTWGEQKKDVNGNLLKQFDYNADGSVKYRFEGQYDARNNIIRKIEYDGESNVVTFKEYDAGDRLVKNTVYTNGTFSSEETYQYNVAGKLLSETHNDGQKITWRECTYDAAGRLIRDTAYDANGAETSFIQYEYDADGYLIRETNSLDTRTLYEYDERGNNIRIIVYKMDGTLRSWTEKEYDARGNNTKFMQYNADGSVAQGIGREYDVRGNLIKYIQYGKDGAISSWDEYEYDSGNNVIKHTYFKAGALNNWEENVYDAHGNLILVRYYNEHGSVSSWTESTYTGVYMPVK